jgi:hypothetical protein
MTKETEYQPGVESSMRKTVIVSRRLGSLMIVSALALVAAMAYTNGRYELVSVVSVLVGGGTVLITGVSAAKSYQSHAEARSEGR